MDETGSANTSVTAPSAKLELGDLSASIATELAVGLSTAAEIREKFGLTVPQWKVLTANPFFRGMVREAIKAFQGSVNAGKRITLKAEVMLEDSLADLYGIVKNLETPSGERIKAVQTMAELAGRGKGAAVADAGNSAPKGFTLNINVGDGKNVTIQGSTSGSNERDV